MNLTTGYSQAGEDRYQQHYLNEVMVMLGVFTEDASRLAGLYCLHANRHSVTRQDIELGLKTRAFHGDEFWNRNDIQQKLTEMRQFLNQPNQNESENEYESDYEYDYEGEGEGEGEMSEIPDEMDTEEIDTEEILEPFIKSECTCELCTTLNGIQEKWVTWNPTDKMEISIKNSINNINF